MPSHHIEHQHRFFLCAAPHCARRPSAGNGWPWVTPLPLELPAQKAEEPLYLAHRHLFIYGTKGNAHTKQKRHLKSSCKATLKGGPGISALLAQGGGRYLCLPLARDAWLHPCYSGLVQGWAIPRNKEQWPLQCTQLWFKVETFQRALPFFFFSANN